MLEHYGLLIFKLSLGFGLIIGYLYLTGKHQLSKMTPIDFVGNFVIGGAIGGVIYSDDIGIYTYIITLLIALFIVYAISAVTARFSFAKAVTIGIPLVIINNGKFCYDVINENKNKIDFSDILSKLHQQGIMKLSDVDYLQLEPTGNIIAVKGDGEKPSVVIYDNGGYSSFNLERLDLKEESIQKVIEDNDIKDIILIEFCDSTLKILTCESENSIKI